MNRVTKRARDRQDRALADSAQPYNDLLHRIAMSQTTVLDSVILQNLVSLTPGFSSAIWAEHFLSMGYPKHDSVGGAYNMASVVASCSPANARRSWGKFFKSAKSTEQARESQKKLSGEL